jgi:chromosome segregation ATPase
MDKSKYIKVTDKNSKSTVVLASNTSFYQSQGYKIEEPTEKEIEAYFPTVKTITGSEEKVDTSEIEEQLKKAQTSLSEERAEHLTTRNQLTAEQDEHKKTKDAFATLDSEYKKAQTSLSEATANIEKLNAELAKLKPSK